MPLTVTSVLLTHPRWCKAERAGAKSFLPGIFHTALYASVCPHFTVGNKSYLNKSGPGLLSCQPDTGVWRAFLPQLPLALRPRWGGTAGTHWWFWPVSRSMDQFVLHSSPAAALWGDVSKHSDGTSLPLQTHLHTQLPQVGFYNLLVKTGVFLPLCICTPRNSSDSSLLCCTRKCSRSITFCESAFFGFLISHWDVGQNLWLTKSHWSSGWYKGSG